MSKKIPTALVMQDLSSVGRCALTVAIPVLAALGVQPIPLPTALLSAHTAFPDPIIADMTDYAERCVEKWSSDGAAFDCVYTGYLSSLRQADIAEKLLTSNLHALKIVDPVLGDNGVMYRSLPEALIDRFRVLSRHADLITPNLTEAALLTGTTYPKLAVTKEQLTALANDLLALGSKSVLITGVSLEDCSANVWASSEGTVHILPYEATPGSFPGTGDLFTSVLAGYLLRRCGMDKSVGKAADFVRAVVADTHAAGTDPRHGVLLERSLHMLLQEAE